MQLGRKTTGKKHIVEQLLQDGRAHEHGRSDRKYQGRTSFMSV